MPGRRHFRGPQRPPSAAGEVVPALSDPVPSSSALPEGAGTLPPPEEGSRPRRRRGRGRRGRGSAADDRAGDSGLSPASAGERSQLAAREPGGTEPLPEETGRPRRRRRRGRNRREGSAIDAAAEGHSAEGELPADYIALPVERGTPLLFESEQRALITREIEREIEEEERRPAKAKRINAGKLFWYIRGKSYVPIPELRRRFDIGPDEMGVIQDDGQKLYVGLPQEVADVVATLNRQRKIGLECSADFSTGVVIGIFPLYQA